ncbi:unnamed protein product [Malus baccata var. baccata]
MAATLSLLKLPILPQNSSIPTEPSNAKDSTKLLTTTTDRLKSTSFPCRQVQLNALAVGGEFGILEGRTFAPIHPIVMGGLFVYTLWAGYLGWQRRRMRIVVRTIQEEINELKKQVKPTPVTPEGTPAEASPLHSKFSSSLRKELVKRSYRDKHFNAGSILLAFGVFESVGGGLNTWFRTGKLFPGRHLNTNLSSTMASQPSRPWFRLGSIVRPVSTPAPAPTPVPAPAPAPMVIPSMRPMAPAPEPTPPPPPPPTTTALPPPLPPAAMAPPPNATAPPLPPPPTATPSPPPPLRVTTSSVLSSPVKKASVPSSPVNKAVSSSVPSSPATKVSGAPSYSGVPSPTRTKATTTSTTTSVPNSPANKPQTPSTSSPKPAISATNSPPSYKPLPPHTYSPPKPTTISSTAREANNYNNQSPKTIGPAVNQTPPQSPKLKQTAPPPSPLTLPLSQLRPNTSDNQTDQPKFPIEAEQKTVLVQQKTIDQQKPNSWFSSFTSGNSKGADFRESPKPSNNSPSSKNEGETKERLISHKKSPSSSDHEAAGIRVITVAGENRGALMELIKSPKKHGSGEHSHYIHKKGNDKTLMGNQSDQSSYSGSSDSGSEEGKHKSKDKSHRTGKAAASKPASAFMNSNVQGINNSIVYNSSLTHHDPGVHLAFSKKPNGEGFEAKSHHANGRNS